MTERINTARWIASAGRWQINVQRDGVRKTFTSSTRGRAGQREANKKADLWLQAEMIAPSARVSAVYPVFLEQKMQTTSVGNWRPMESRWRNWILPSIGSRSLSRLTVGALQDTINAALAAGQSKKALQNLRADLSAFLRWCRQHQYTTLTCEDVSVPKAAQAGERRILQPRDMVVLFNTDTTLYRGKRMEDEFINAYRFAVLTGLRPGEIIGLQWEDWHGKQINLRRSVNIYGDTTKGKNENAQRPVYLSDLAVSVLEDQRRKVPSGKSVFCVSGERLLYSRWQAYCRANGIEPISLYELRHTFVSLADALPEGQLKKIVGHSRSMDTYGVYAHQVSGEADAITGSLSEIFHQIVDVK